MSSLEEEKHPSCLDQRDEIVICTPLSAPSKVPYWRQFYELRYVRGTVEDEKYFSLVLLEATNAVKTTRVGREKVFHLSNFEENKIY